MSTATDIRTGTRERLGSTLFFALVLHGVIILGITFGGLDLRGSSDSSTLRVTVVVPSERDQTSDSDVLAQADSRGSGTQVAPADPAAPLPSPAQALDSPPQTGADAETSLPGQLQPTPDLLVSRDPAQREVLSLPDPTERASDLPRLARPADDPSRPQTRLFTDDEHLEVAAPLRELEIAPDTRAHEAAAYLAAWRTRVEQIGTLNFPAQIQAAAGANPVLEVAIRADGTLADIVLIRSSGQPVLDQAALDILRLASPFQPFDQALAGSYDQLRFAYEWRFDDGFATGP